MGFFFLAHIRDKTFPVTSENSNILISFLYLYVLIENVGNSLSSFMFLKQMLSKVILLLRGIAVCTVQILLSGFLSNTQLYAMLA